MSDRANPGHNPGPDAAYDRKKMVDRLVFLRTVLLRKHPFFGELLMRMNFGLANCETACTDMKNIVFDPAFMSRLSDKELAFVLMHEVMHCVLKHPARGEGRLHMLYNIACDIVVNSNILKSMGEKDISVDGEYAMHLTPFGEEGYKYSAEEVYYMLLKKPQIPMRKSGGGRSSEHDMKSPKELGTMDNHEVWEMIDITESEEDRWDREVLRVESKGYSIDVLPQSVRAVYERDLKAAKLRWKELLRDFVSSNTFFTDYSFAPPDRRFTDSPYILPAENTYSEDTVQDIWFCVDTSASISDEELAYLYTEVMNVVNEVKGCSGLFSFFDAEVTEPVEFSRLNDFDKVEPVGGGGTSFQAIFDYMAEKMRNHLPNALVILTDGVAPDVDERCALSVPVLWIIIDDEKMTKPWGRTIHCSTE